MGKFEPVMVQYTASAAVTVNNKAGVLYYAKVTGDTSGARIFINDGAVTKITLIVPANNGQVEFSPYTDQRPIFTTDIDLVVSGTATATALT